MPRATSDKIAAMFTVEHLEGRLVATRLSSLASVDEVQNLGARFREVVSALPGQVVICGDYRGIRVFAPDVAERFSGMLTVANPRVERSAILLAPDAATAALQIERTVKQAANPARRTFRATGELETWLGELLDANEKKRLHEFLSG
jgi:hypothetical protein